MTAYEKAKKKHQSRLKKLEAQMIAMVERHDTQVTVAAFILCDKFSKLRPKNKIVILA